jgi:hypothetical protein
MKDDVADPTPACLALIERSVTGLAAAARELERSPAWHDVLGTIDRLAALLGADVGPPAPSERAEADPAQVGRAAADWVRSLVLPEYLESSGPGRARYRVRLPEEARADGLGALADFLESLGLRIDLSVEGETVRLAMAVGGGDRPALAARCAADRLELDLDLDATRGALRHMAALVERVPVARRAAEGLELEELSGVLRFTFAAAGGQMRIAGALREPLRIVGRNDDGPVRIEVGASELLAIEGEAAGALKARVEVGAVEARLPAAVVDSGPGTAEYRLARAGGELQATRGDRALKLRSLTLGGQPAVARRDGKVVATVDLGAGSAGLDLQPLEPGRFVLAPEGDLALRLGAAGQEVTVSAPAGTRIEVAPGGLRVQKGRLLLRGTGAAAPIEVGEGRALVRRKDPRPGEPHPLLRFYESATIQ